MNNYASGRECIVQKFNKDNKCMDGVHCRFIAWGVEPEEFRDGVGNWTVGIIELDDGTLYTTTPSNIRFTKPLSGRIIE